MIQVVVLRGGSSSADSSDHSVSNNSSDESAGKVTKAKQTKIAVTSNKRKHPSGIDAKPAPTPTWTRKHAKLEEDNGAHGNMEEPDELSPIWPLATSMDPPEANQPMAMLPTAVQFSNHNRSAHVDHPPHPPAWTDFTPRKPSKLKLKRTHGHDAPAASSANPPDSSCLGCSPTTSHVSPSMSLGASFRIAACIVTTVKQRQRASARHTHGTRLANQVCTPTFHSSFPNHRTL